MVDRIGQQLGNYRLTRLLGQGGFAEVYLGEHIHLNTLAAVKVLHTQLASEDVESFRAEARTVARLEHPNIVRVLEFGIEGTVPFLVMSYAPNGSLRQRHPRGTPLPVNLILQYLKQVADALQYAHDEKLIHRDIKPENMLLGRRNEVLLSDFGIAIVSQTSRSKSVQEVIGTVAYMSPEMLQGKPRAASDQYALGIVVYEWFCGERPFHGAFTELASQHMFVPPPSLREKIPSISPDIEQVVMRALAKDPQQRFPNVRAFASALEQASQAAAYQPTVYAPPAFQPFQPTQLALPPNSPRQQTATPTPANQFHQPPGGTSTPSQPVSSPMVTHPSSPSGQWSRPTMLPSTPSSQPGLLTPPSLQPILPTVAAVPSHSSPQSTTLGDSPNPSLPPTQLASSPGQLFQPTVLASPPSDESSLPGIPGSLPGEAKSPKQGISRRTIVVGLAGLAVVGVAGGSLLWLAHSQQPSAPVSPSIPPTAAPTPTPSPTPLPIGSTLYIYLGHSKAQVGVVSAVAWSPDGRRLASGSWDATVQVWDAADGGNVYTYRGHTDGVYAVAWSPDGKQIVSGGGNVNNGRGDTSVQVWDAADGGHLLTYSGHTDQVNAVAWSPDGRRLASGSVDQTVQVWDAADGGNVYTYRGHTDGVDAVVWSPDGKRIASGSYDQTVQVWVAG